MTTRGINKTKARAALHHKGWSQARLARELGTSEGHVSRIFNGLIPSEGFAHRMAEALGEPDLWRKR